MARYSIIFFILLFWSLTTKADNNLFQINDTLIRSAFFELNQAEELLEKNSFNEESVANAINLFIDTSKKEKPFVSPIGSNAFWTGFMGGAVGACVSVPLFFLYPPLGFFGCSIGPGAVYYVYDESDNKKETQKAVLGCLVSSCAATAIGGIAFYLIWEGLVLGY